jgi:hypothetical protein
MIELTFDAMVNDALSSAVYYGVAGGLFPILFWMLIIMFLRMR